MQGLFVAFVKRTRRNVLKSVLCGAYYKVKQQTESHKKNEK